MPSIATDFSSVSQGASVLFNSGDVISYSVTGTFVASLQLEYSVSGGNAWQVLRRISAPASDRLVLDLPANGNALIRFSCVAYTSGYARTKISGADATLSQPEQNAASLSIIQAAKRFRARSNPIDKFLGPTQGSGSSLDATYHIKIAAPCDFYAVRIHVFNHTAATPTFKFCVAATETSSTSTAANIGQPIVGGTSFAANLNSTTSPYGWRSGSFAGSATAAATAGTQFAPSVLSSDIIYCKSVPPVDGRLPYLIVRLYGSGANYTFASSAAFANMRTATDANRGRIYQISSNSGDLVAAPGSGNIPVLTTTTIPIAIEYFSHSRGATGIFVGDSLTEAVTLVADGLSNYGLRAGANISTLKNPIGTINCGMSSQNSATYLAEATREIALFKPSFAFFPMWSPNDYAGFSTALNLEAQTVSALARVTQFIEVCKTYNTIPIIWTGIPTPQSLTTAAFDAVRVAANNLIKAYPDIIIADFDALISNGASPAVMKPVYRWSGDTPAGGVHWNEAAIEDISFIASDAISAAIN